MGNEVSRPKGPPPPIAPLTHPTGIIKNLCNPYEVTLKLEEQVGWSGDTFFITDVNGRPCFKMQGKAMSFSQRKILQDVNGIPIVTLRQEMSFGRKKYGIYAGDGEADPRCLATIRASTMFGVTIDIEYTNVDGYPGRMVLEGNFFASEAQVVLPNGQLVARISRSRWNGNELLFGNQTYFVTAAPNADLALVICIAVALDEAKHDQNR